MTGWASPEQYTAPVEPICPHGLTLDVYCGTCEWDAYTAEASRPTTLRERLADADWLLAAVVAAAVLAVGLYLWRK